MPSSSYFNEREFTSDLGNATTSSQGSSRNGSQSEFLVEDDLSMKANNNTRNMSSYLIDTAQSVMQNTVKYESTPNPETGMTSQDMDNSVSDDLSDEPEPEFLAKIKMDFSLEYDNKKYEVIQKKGGKKQSKIPVPMNCKNSNYIDRKHFYIYSLEK